MLNIPVIVVSLPEREDRRMQVSKEIPKLFNSSPLFIDGVRGDDTRLNIIKAMKNAISAAKELNYEYVAILEDDCKISNSPKVLDHVLNSINNVPEDAEALLFGIYGGRPQPVNHYWSKIYNFCGAQFIIYERSFYDKVLNHDFKEKHFDRGLSDCLKCYVLNEFVATQHNGYSDQRGKQVNDDHFLEKYKLL